MENLYELIIDDPYNLIGQHCSMFLWGISANVKSDLKLLFRVAKNFKTTGNLFYNVLYDVLGITMIAASSFNKAREIIMVMSIAAHEVVFQLQDKDSLLVLIKQYLHKAQERMKLFYDKRHNEMTFEIGDWVYLKLQAHKQHFIERRIVHKLFAKYYGPFEVIKRIGTVAYKLRRPNSAKIHPVWPCSMFPYLRRRLGCMLWLILTYLLLWLIQRPKFSGGRCHVGICC